MAGCRPGRDGPASHPDSRLWDLSVDWYYRRLSRQQPGKPTVGYHVAADDRIAPAWQNPRVGDIIADGPPGTAYYVVRQAEPGKSWVLFTDTHLRYLLPACWTTPGWAYSASSATASCWPSRNRARRG